MIDYDQATPADFEQILGLNELAIPAVNRIDAAELAGLHQQARALIVARAAGRVAGFLLALDETASYDSLNYQYFRSHYDRFAYVDRIIVDQDFRGSGIGTGLYAALFQATPEAPRITCEVNVQPPNLGSLGFHATLGFEVVAEQDTEGGEKRVALMVLDRSGNAAPHR